MNQIEVYIKNGYEVMNALIEKLFTYIYIALAIYFAAAFICTKEEMALLVSLWCWTMVEIRTMKIPKIYIGIEKEQKQEERKDDT